MPPVEPEEFIASWDEWRELSPKGNPRKKKEPLFDTFNGLEVRVALVHAPDYKPQQASTILGSSSVYNLLYPRFATEPVESFVVLCLNAKHKVLGVHVVARGQITQVDVHPGAVYQAALLSNAAAIIVSHNHPSGDVEPSPEDLVLTQRLVVAGKVLGVPLLDHLVISGERYTSFADRGLLPTMTAGEAIRAAAEGFE